jgi:hypothetical protein
MQYNFNKNEFWAYWLLREINQNIFVPCPTTDLDVVHTYVCIFGERGMMSSVLDLF